jgi:hypothetical protein
MLEEERAGGDFGPWRTLAQVRVGNDRKPPPKKRIAKTDDIASPYLVSGSDFSWHDPSDYLHTDRSAVVIWVLPPECESSMCTIGVIQIGALS